MNSKKTIYTLLLVLVAGALHAQKKVQVVGKVVEEKSSEGIPFATIAVRDLESDRPITGVTTDVDGKFSLSFASSADFYVEVSFLGFTTKRIDEVTVKYGVVDVGTVSLSEDTQLLDEVVVEGEKSRTEFQIDKRVFNVGNDISSQGMGALEVLDRVPSVTVNIEGEVSLRGSAGVQILIDGKPSILADDQSN
ncbi:MAG: carboxypeptidase-like regulatory domain-containing protein, partial [Bacteroidota bacterium]